VTLEERVWQYAEKHQPFTLEGGTRHTYTGISWIDKLKTEQGSFIYEALMKTERLPTGTQESVSTLIAIYIAENDQGELHEVERETVGGNYDPPQD